MKMKYFVLFFVALGLAGCGATQNTVQPTLSATKAPEPTITIISQPTPTITEQASPTSKPSRTPTQSATLGPSRTLDPTQMAFKTYTAPTVEAEQTSSQLTQEARPTIMAVFPESCGSLYPSFSPDGNWIAEDCNQEFHISRRGGGKTIVILNKELSSPDFDVAYIISQSWSQDNKYLYFATRFCCNDSGSWGSEGPLYRLEIESAKWVKIIDGSGSYSFSPTGRRLLHITGGMSIKFHIIDLKSNAEQWLELKGFQDAGGVRWSPDGMRFVVTTRVGNLYEENTQFSLFLVSLNDLSYTRLTPLYKIKSLFATDWSANDVVTVNSCTFNGFYMMCEQHFYNVKPK